MISYSQLSIYIVVALIFYFAYRWEKSKKPSEFHLLRNHFQKVAYPDLNIIGYGDYFISYECNNKKIIEYFISMSAYRKRLEEIKENNSISNLDHGRLAYRAWKNWK